MILELLVGCTASAGAYFIGRVCCMCFGKDEEQNAVPATSNRRSTVTAAQPPQLRPQRSSNNPQTFTYSGLPHSTYSNYQAQTKRQPQTQPVSTIPATINADYEYARELARQELKKYKEQQELQREQQQRAAALIAQTHRSDYATSYAGKVNRPSSSSTNTPVQRNKNSFISSTATHSVCKDVKTINGPPQNKLTNNNKTNNSILQVNSASRNSGSTKSATHKPAAQPKNANRPFLDAYHPSREMINLFNCKFHNDNQLNYAEKELLQDLRYFKDCVIESPSEYFKLFKYALNIEDMAAQAEQFRFEFINVRITKLQDDKYSFDFPKNKVLPELCEDMSLSVVPMSLYKSGKINYNNEIIFIQKITEVDKENGSITFEKKFFIARNNRNQNILKIDPDSAYSIRFTPNRYTFRASHDSLNLMKRRQLESFFFNLDTNYLKETNTLDRSSQNIHQWKNSNVIDNAEQMQAIRNIVNRSSYPFPYIVHGPPGTGKTSMIVEAIVQILKLRPNSRILVTAQSNSACDEIGVRLLKFVNDDVVFRFYSETQQKQEERRKTQLPLKRISNLRDGGLSDAEIDLEQYDVVIATLVSSQTLHKFSNEKTNHYLFDYIIVDECAAATEPEVLIPLVGFATDMQKITASIVLVGDHKQFGPLIKSRRALDMGLGASLMERILDNSNYQMDEHNCYDSDYVTQLLDNYRSHPAILKFSNVYFYDSKLRTRWPRSERILGRKWNPFNNKDFPILIHNTKEASEVEENGTSSFNKKEIGFVIHYVKQLLVNRNKSNNITEDDIGIVSPYRAQLAILKSALRGYTNVEIGTAEYYQGREKRIIIISTVKSRTGSGFMKSEKRLNVCFTRAKCLLIIVGNVETLQHDSDLWKMFVHFCADNNAICGEFFNLGGLTEPEKKTLQKLNNFDDDPYDPYDSE